MTRSFDVFFYLRLNKRLNKQPWDWWFETLSWSLWRQCNVARCAGKHFKLTFYRSSCICQGTMSWPLGRLTRSHHGPSWWRHQMETFSALLAIGAGNSPVTGEFPSQRPVTQSFSSICAGVNHGVNNREAGHLRRHRAHYDVTVMHKTVYHKKTLMIHWKTQTSIMIQGISIHDFFVTWIIRGSHV